MSRQKHKISTNESDEEVITDRPTKSDAITNKPAENINKLAGIVIEPARITRPTGCEYGKEYPLRDGLLLDIMLCHTCLLED
jgi:hypothetical protein